MALTVTPTDEMKTLKVGEKIYEIVDDEARTDLNTVKAEFVQIVDASTNLYNPNDLDKFNGRIGGSGSPVYDSSLITTGFIPCVNGNVFYASRENDRNHERTTMSLNYAYIFDSDKTRIGQNISNPGTSFTISNESAAYVRFTFLASYSNPMVSLVQNAEYAPFGSISLNSDIKEEIVDEANKYVYNRDLGAIGVAINKVESSYSDITNVDGMLVGFQVGADDYSTSGRVDIYTFGNGYDKPYTALKTIYHKFGHCNTVDYSETNGCLILGNGSGDYDLQGKIIIIPDFATIIFNASQGDELTLDSTDAIVIDCSSYNLGGKFNVLWGETNGTTANIAYLITAKYGSSTTDLDAGDNGTVRRLLMGQGSNELPYGAYISGATTNEFNGTFDILATYTQSGTNYKHANQGSCFHDGIYVGIGHDCLKMWKLHTDDRNNALWYEEKSQIAYNADGTKITSQGTSGICIIDDYMFIGQGNVGILIFKR